MTKNMDDLLRSLQESAEPVELAGMISKFQRRSSVLRVLLILLASGLAITCVAGTIVPGVIPTDGTITYDRIVFALVAALLGLVGGYVQLLKKNDTRVDQMRQDMKMDRELFKQICTLVERMTRDKASPTMVEPDVAAKIDRMLRYGKDSEKS